MKKNVLIMKGRVLFLVFFLAALFSNTAYAQGFIDQDTIVRKLVKCGTKANICIEDVTAAQVALAKITDNGKPYAGTVEACKADTTLAYDFSSLTNPGPYVLDSLTINGKFFSKINIVSIKALSDSLTKWDTTADWKYDDATKKMVGGKTTSKYSAINISTTGIIVSNNKIGLNIGVQGSGVALQFEEGFHKVLVEVASLNLKDSLFLYIVCPKSDISTKTVKVGSTEKFCIDTKDLPTGKVLKLDNLTPVTAASSIEFKILPNNDCFEVKGSKKGKDTLFLVANGIGGIKDTTIMYLSIEGTTAVLGHHYVNENVYEAQKKKYCINTDALITGSTDSIKTVTNICATKSGKEVKFTIKPTDNCIEMEGLKAGGLDTACVVITNNKGKTDTTTIYARVVKECKGLIKLDSAVTYVADCSLKGQICFSDFKPADSLKYSFFADGNIYLDDKVGCDFDTIIAYNYSIMLVNGNFLPPPYTVDSWTVNGTKFNGTFDKIDSLVTLMNKFDPKGKWVLDTAKQLIIGGVKSNKYSPIFITNQTFLVESELGFNIGLNAKGLALSFEKGVHIVVVTENATGCTDTIKTFVSCLKADEIDITIEETQKDTFCLDIVELFSDPVKTTNTIVDANNKNVDFTISADKKCIIFTGNKIGSDTAKIIACDKYNYCDTTYIYVNVIKKGTNPSPKIFKDTLLVGESASYCIDTSLFLKGKKFKSFDAKSQSNFADIVLDAKTFCINYKGIKATGTDTSTIILCSTVSCDTFKAYITVRPALLPKDVVLDTIPLLSTFTYCLPADKFPGVDFTKTPLEVKNTCEKTNGRVGFTVQTNNTCTAPTGFGYSIIYKGNKVGIDTACVQVKDSTGKTATLKVVVRVIPRKPYILQDTILVGQQEVYCLENSKLDFNAAIDTFYNFCPITKSPEVSYALLEAGNCQSGFGIVASGIKEGKDTACIAIKDKLGNLDTAFVYVTVIKPKAQTKVILDSLYFFQTNSTCIDTLALGLKGPLKIEDVCKSKNGNQVIFSLDTVNTCVTANGVKGIKIAWTADETVGIDTACWKITDKNGKSDTIRIIVKVKRPTPEVITDKVEVDGTFTVCLDKKQIDPKIDSIKFCKPLSKGVNAKFELIDSSKCVKITGLKVGKDTACVYLIDQFGVKDTARIYIDVVAKGSIKVTAIDDTQKGPKNKDIKIVVLKNDTYDKADSLKVKITIIPKANGGVGPNNGAVISVDNKTGTMTYMPAFDFCGKDSFTYSLCIGNVCDTAKVVINIACDTSGTFTIFNGFSPNGDDVNDKFIIQGVDAPEFKGNTLVIFNRWGNEVYRKDDYDNSWDGTWQGNGKELPSGTYYYMLCLPDKQIKSGFLELRR